MPFDVHYWLNEFINRLKTAFGSRLTAVGLQGSFKRGDAHPQSDIDAVVILDLITPRDILIYKSLLSQMPPTDSHPVCGFFGGQEDLKNWPRGELFQFTQDTQILYGSLEKILPPPTRSEALSAAKTGAGTLYHTLVHTWIHGELTPSFMQNLCKTAFFMLQAAHYALNGEYIAEKKRLYEKLTDPSTRLVLRSAAAPITQPKKLAAALLKLCQRILAA